MTVTVQIPYRRADGPLHLLVEPASSFSTASGRRKHGPQRRRRWRKVHAGDGPRDVQFGEPPRPAGAGPRGVDRQRSPLMAPTTPAAASHRRAGRRDHPDPQERTAWKEDGPAAVARRDPARHPRRLEAWTGYHARSRIEAKMRCLKAFGDSRRTRPSSTDRQVHIRIALMNRFNALGPRSLAWRCTDGGSSTCNNADQMRQMNPLRFEDLVVDLLLAMGYGSGREAMQRQLERTRARATAASTG